MIASDIAPPMRPLLSAVLAALLLGPGCATSLATRQTARTLEPGHFSVDAAAGAGLPLGTIAQVVGVGGAQTRKLLDAVQSRTPYAVTDQDKQELISAAVALVVNPPSVGWEGGVRAGVLPDLDLGLRYSVNALRGDVKYRFFQDAQPGSRLDVAAGLAVSRYLFSNPAVEVLEFVQMGDFSRWDVEVPVYASREWGEWLRIYGAVKYIYSRTELDENLVATADQATYLTGIDFRLNDVLHTHFVGGTAGLKIGYRYVYFVAELTAGYALGSVRVLGAERSLAGPVLFPALGVDVQL